jgi:hypothetical protein
MRPVALLVAGTALLAGCTDLPAVQNFASTASTISLNEPVFSGWPDAYQRMTNLAGSGVVRAYDPKAEQSFVAETSQDTADARLATQAARMLGLYLQALAQLAGGATPDVGKQASAIQSSIETGGIANPEVATATRALSLLLNSSQNATVGIIVERANGPVQTITTYLAATADAIRLAYKRAMLASDQYWTSIGVRAGNPYIRLLVLQRAMTDDDTYYSEQMSRAAAAKVAFTKIGADHAALAGNANDLAGAYATLAADQPLLQSALAAILK